MDTKGIARSLRVQMKNLGLDLTHAQVLELMAKTADVKDWNVLAARVGPVASSSGATLASTEAPMQAASTTGLFCPKCGEHGTVSQVSSAFVEQGPSGKNGYMFEGNADHMSCSVCGHQFLDWVSDWPDYDLDKGYLIFVERRSQIRTPEHEDHWSAHLYPAGHVRAVLDVQGCGRAERYAQATDNESVAGTARQEVLAGNDNHLLIDQLQAYDLNRAYSAVGSTLNDAVKALLAKLSAEVVGNVLNQSIGMG